MVSKLNRGYILVQVHVKFSGIQEEFWHKIINTNKL